MRLWFAHLSRRAAFSGALTPRERLQEMLPVLPPPGIAEWHPAPDRLARNYTYQVLLIDEWRRAGVEVVFLNRPLGQSPEDDLLLQVQGIVAEYERAKIMERSRRGKKHAAQRGSLNVMSCAPFGYRYISVHDGGGQARFEPVPEQAQIVKHVFEWIARIAVVSARYAGVFRKLVSEPNPAKPSGRGRRFGTSFKTPPITERLRLERPA